jgi:hypothetical protein
MSQKPFNSSQATSAPLYGAPYKHSRVCHHIYLTYDPPVRFSLASVDSARSIVEGSVIE